MMSPSSVFKLTLLGVAAVSIAACTPRRPVETATPPADPNPEYTGTPTGPVSGTPTAPVPGTEQDFVVNVGDRVYFDLDSYRIQPSAFARLDAQAQWLLRYPAVNVRIEGNADERGTREYNLALGARRAEAVRTYLVERGVPAGRIDTISFGKERPIIAGSNESSWAQNRNGHTAIVSGASR